MYQAKVIYFFLENGLCIEIQLFFLLAPNLAKHFIAVIHIKDFQDVCCARATSLHFI